MPHGFFSKDELIKAIVSGQFIPAGKDMSGVDFSGVTLTGDDSTDEDFRIDFSGCNLTGANFTDSTLLGVRFRGAIMDNAKFDNADLETCNFCWAKGEAVSFKGAKDNESTFNDAAFPGADLREFSLYKSDFYGADLSGADLRGIDPGRVGFRFTKFDYTILTEGAAQAIIEGANITNSTTEGARFDEGVEAEWAAYKADCDEDLANEMAKLNAPGTRERLTLMEQMLGQRYTHRGIERVADLERHLPGRRSPEAERQALIEGDCRLAADWWTDQVRAGRDRNREANPNSRSGNVSDKAIESFRKVLFEFMRMNRSPEARTDYHPEGSLRQACWNVDGVNGHDMEYLLPSKSYTCWPGFGPDQGLSAHSIRDDDSIMLRQPGESLEAARARVQADKIRAQSFNMERDAHSLGRTVAEALLEDDDINDWRFGLVQRTVAAAVLADGVSALPAAAEVAWSTISEGRPFADAPRYVLRFIRAKYSTAPDGGLMEKGWDGKFQPVTGHFDRDEIERFIAEAGVSDGSVREVVMRDGSFVRYDANGKIHCDGAPAVRDKDGNEAWFEHGKRLPGPKLQPHVVRSVNEPKINR